MNVLNADFVTERQPTVIDLFSGCGGSSLGLKMAGFKELLAVEWDDNAAATFRLNFPEVDLFHGDVCKLISGEVMRRTELRSGELGLLTGSPPCQGFSTAGRRKFNDPRNSLFMEYARLLRDLQPKAFMMENVTGMVKGHMKQAYLKIMAELRSCGYAVKGQVMNAMYYGVPQSRERVILVGVRKDLGIEPSHPRPSAKPLTAGEALKDVNPTEIVKLSPLYLRYWHQTPIGEPMGKSFSDYKIDPRKPAPTIKKNAHFARWDEPRWLAVNEFAACGSFPPTFQWVDRRSAIMRIGNSVPPNLSKAIALHIKTEVLGKISCPGLTTCSA